jgi:hypothetical protein
MWKYEEQMKKECRQIHCVNRVDYGHSGGLEVGLCILNRQEWQKWLQEQMEIMRNTLRLRD